MKGIDLSRLFYEQYGAPMLREQFEELLPYIAVGFVGSGSERYGFDDEISKDHDYEAGFAIYLPGEDIVDRKQAFQLERAYSKLPKEFMGIKRQPLSPVGGNRNGPIRTADFYISKAGTPDGVLTNEQWLSIPDYALAEATNGEVFYDGYGEFTKIRRALSDMPEDIKRKRIAGNLLIMAQAGQYNFMRCVDRCEYEAAMLASVEFVNAAIKAVFLLNGGYAPYYKWSFRALRETGETEIADKLAYILLSGDDADAERRYWTIEEVSAAVIAKLNEKELTKAICGDLEKHAYSVNDGIHDAEIRNLNILVSV